MAQNTHIDLTSSAWSLLTDVDVSAITFQNVTPNFIWVLATVGATAPTSTDGALRYEFAQGELNVTLGDLFPGVTNATRVYAIAGNEAGGTAKVMVSHA